MRRMQMALPPSEPVSNKIIIPSPEQLDIWQEMTSCYSHTLLVNAVAGSGKSTTLLEGARHINQTGGGKNIVYLAFNKHIQSDMQAKAGNAMHTMTYHAMGFAALRNLGEVKVDDNRMWPLSEQVLGKEKDKYWLRSGAVKLSRLAKHVDATRREQLEGLVESHGLDFGTEEQEQEVVAAVPALLDAATLFPHGHLMSIDYDDMCWLPKRMNLALPHGHVVLCDESQDLNAVQQWMAVRIGGRLVIVGDRNQAIYGFRGSDYRSMDNLAALATQPVQEFPLNFTRRCPKSHVRLAQVIVPAIQALPDAIEGVVRLTGAGELVAEGLAGDMVLCRTNAPLIAMANRLLAVGKRAVVKGKDVGTQILMLLERAVRESGEQTITQMLKAASQITDHDVAKFLTMRGGKGQVRADMAEDRLQCLVNSTVGCSTVPAVRRKLKELFADTGFENAIVLGTIHKMKGLEADRVMVLSPELLPHPNATRPAEQAQEMNCLYVALTRSRNELWFIDGIPSPLAGLVENSV